MPGKEGSFGLSGSGSCEDVWLNDCSGVWACRARRLVNFSVKDFIL